MRVLFPSFFKHRYTSFAFFLVIYTDWSGFSLGRKQNRINAILKNVEEYDLFDADKNPAVQDDEIVSNLDIAPKIAIGTQDSFNGLQTSGSSIGDLQKEIQSMASFFPESTHSTG